MFKHQLNTVASLVLLTTFLLIPELNSCQTATGTREKTQEKPQALTAEKKQQIKAILSDYDASKLTADDARAIHNRFREAGIHAGPEINSIITEAGFDPEKLKKLAPPPDSDMKEKKGPPSLNERIGIIDEKICTPLKLTDAQKVTVEKAFTDFYNETDALVKAAATPGVPVDKAKIEPLKKSRDEKIRKVLSSEQFREYQELEKTIRPEKKKEEGKK